MAHERSTDQPGPSRRSVLIGASAAMSAVPLMSVCAPPATAASARAAAADSGTWIPKEAQLPWVKNARQDQGKRPTATHVITLGVGGGPSWYEEGELAGIGTAIVVGGHTYLVDVGDRVPEQYKRANPNRHDAYAEFSTLAGVFLTHLHSDHIIDYFKLFNYGWWVGLSQVSEPVVVRGPGRRETVTRPHDPTQAREPFHPENPMPGTVDLTEAVFAAYATDINDRQRDNGFPELRALLDVQDIVIPGASVEWESMKTMPTMDPFTVHEDDRVRVTAIAVNHFPIYPAFAYRFDTDDGSIVISGDTGPSPNLITLAKGADVLLHEVIDNAWIDTVYKDREGVAQHLREAHTSTSLLGGIAEEAGVSTLVLHHLVPANPPLERFLTARNGFSGNFHIAADLDVIPLRRP